MGLLTINDGSSRSHPEPTAMDEHPAGTEMFVIPDIGEEGCGCGCEEEQIDYYAPLKIE